MDGFLHRTDLDGIDWIHNCMFLFETCEYMPLMKSLLRYPVMLTAIPAKAPAAMFWTSEKLGGSPS